MLKKALRRFKENETGTVIVELVIVLPLIMLWFVGSFVYFDAFKLFNTTQKATYTVADITSRINVFYDSDLAEFQALFEAMVSSKAGQTSLRISSVTDVSSDPQTDDLKLEWSFATNTTTNFASSADLPVQSIPKLAFGENVVIVETFYSYTPLFTGVGMSSKTYSHLIVIAPRFTPFLAYEKGAKTS